MSSPVYVMLCATFVFVIGAVAGYEYRDQFKFKMMANVDAAEKPEEYRSLRDYASPSIRSHSTSPAFADPYLSARHPFAGSLLGLGPEVAPPGEQHSYSSQKSFFVNKQLVSFNPAVEKKTPHWMKMSALDKPYVPFYMPKPYSLMAATVEKPPGRGNLYPPIAVKMYAATAFLPIKSDKQTPNLPFFVSKPTSSYADTGPKDRYVFGQASPEKLPATGYKMLPEQQYEKRAPEPPYGYNTIMESTYPIHAPPHQKLIPLAVEKPYPLQYQIEKPIPGYPMYQMEKGFSHPAVAGLPVPIRIPTDLPAAVPVDEPFFIRVEEPRASGSTNQQHSLAFNFKPQLFMSTALLRQLAAAQSNASSSAQRPVTSSRAAASSRPLVDETEDIEPEGTDIVNEYESLRTAVGVNSTMANTTTTVTPTTTTTTTTTTASTTTITMSTASVSPEVNTTTADTLSSTTLPSPSTLNP